MKEKKLTIVFIMVLALFSAINLLTPSKAFSSKENRFLQTFPNISYDSIINGKFGNDFEKYASDQFVFRDQWIGLKTLSERLILKQDNGRVYFGKEGFLFDIQEPIPSIQKDNNIKSLNTFVDNLKQKHPSLQIHTMLVPTKAQVLKDKLPPYAPVLDEEKLETDIRNKLSNNNHIISLLSLFDYENNSDLYYKTDHHWTTQGAYHAYAAYLRSIDGLPIQEDAFIIKTISNDFLGTSYRKANFYTSQPDIIQSYTSKIPVSLTVTINDTTSTNTVYDPSYLDKTDKYSYFFGGDQAKIEINTNHKNNKSIVVIKDSLANSMIPFLVNHYENIYVFDTRHYGGSIKSFVDENKIDDVLLVFNTQTLLTEKTLSRLSK